jgi:hypothetical protein
MGNIAAATQQFGGRRSIELLRERCDLELLHPTFFPGGPVASAERLLHLNGIQSPRATGGMRVPGEVAALFRRHRDRLCCKKAPRCVV